MKFTYFCSWVMALQGIGVHDYPQLTINFHALLRLPWFRHPFTQEYQLRKQLISLISVIVVVRFTFSIPSFLIMCPWNFGYLFLILNISVSPLPFSLRVSCYMLTLSITNTPIKKK